MTVSASTFAARYKLACFFIANHLFETVIKNSSELDLKDVAKLQRDEGFSMASLRLVEQLTAFKSDSELDELKRKIEATGTMFFKKSILTAVVNQGNKPMTDATKEEQKQENLYDKFVVKKLYDSYFSAYAIDDEPLEFLDKTTAAQERATNDLVSVFELGVFDSQTLSTLSNILDFSDKAGAVAAVNSLKSNPRYKIYKHFFGLVSKCL